MEPHAQRADFVLFKKIKQSISKNSVKNPDKDKNALGQKS